jgi:hypothetical protein
MTKRYNIDEVRKEFEIEGYTLITDTYKSAHTKLEYICPNGHKSFTTFSNWHFSKRRCNHCSIHPPVTYEDIKASFEKEGYTLLSKVYIKASIKLEYKCAKGHTHSMPWNSFQQGHRCSECHGNAKLTIEEVKKSFEERGATLLEKEYVNSKTKLNYICKNGHKHSITWDSWRSGHNCPECSDNIKLTIDYIRAEFAKENYILLDEDYKGSKAKLKYRCPQGNIHSISWSKWLYGRRCPHCVEGGIPLDYSYIKNSFEKEGYTLLTKEYKNSNSLLTYVCPDGHETTSKWLNWNRGSRCRRCFADRTMIPFEQVKASFDKEGYTLVSTIYKGSGYKLEVVCPIGHSYSVSYSNWRAGYRCPICGVIKNSGHTHYAWNGGSSFEPYCPIWTDKEFKSDIKERDGNKCLNPCCEGKKGHAGKLVIHHINYTKKDCSPSNLITLCGSCNIKANTDRDWHEAWYKAIMNKRYNRGVV